MIPRPSTMDTLPSTTPKHLRLDARQARLLAGRAIQNPAELKAQEVLALAFALIGMLDTRQGP